jgi:type I restriction enzyme S subunit
MEGIEPEFVEWFLKSKDYWEAISEFTAGIAIPNVNASKLASLELPLAPSAEQRRIVAKLEALLGKVNACQERLAKIPVLLKRFRQAVLAAACLGRLTADWRERNPDSEEWGSVELLEVAERIQIGPFGTQLHTADYISHGIPVINPTHIQGSKIAHDSKLSVSRAKYKELVNYVLQENDIILGRRGEMGRCALVSRKESGWLCGTGSLFVRPKSCVHPEFLFLVLRNGETRAFLESESKGTTMKNLNLQILERVPIPLPPLSEQQEIVRRVDALSALGGQVEARTVRVQSYADKLTPSLLAKAFRGELVPTEAELARAQGRAYESASALLERIRACSLMPQTGRELHRPRRRRKSSTSFHT